MMRASISNLFLILFFSNIINIICLINGNVLTYKGAGNSLKSVSKSSSSSSSGQDRVSAIKGLRSPSYARKIKMGGGLFSDGDSNSDILASNDSRDKKGSTDVVSMIKGSKSVLIGGAVVMVLGGLTYYITQHANIDFNGILQQNVDKIAALGPYGYLYFAALYILAEILAVPAMPLTASSGYLFGLIPGTLTVLLSATTAACISFFIGRTFLRTWAQKMIAGSPRWRAIDGAISKEGFKVILLLRLSPLLPFAVSNYLYGVTSVDFWSFFVATFIGFAPGTFGIVYAGSVGKAVFADGISLPWYAYAGGGLLLAYFGKTVAKVATDAIKDIEKQQALEKKM